MVALSDVFDWPEVVTWTAGLPLMVAITCFFGLKVLQSIREERQKRRKTQGPRRKKKAAQVTGVAILATTVCYTLCVIVGILTHWAPGLPCVTLVKLWCAFYQMSKMIMYTVFVLRVKKVYGNSAYAYKNQTLYPLLGFCWTLGALSLVITAITPKAKEKKHKYVRVCDEDFELWHIFLFAVLDVVASASCLLLFTRPLQQMLKARIIDLRKDAIAGRRPTTSKTEKLRKVALRYSIVTWTAICTTFLMLFTVATMHTTVLVPVDMVVNAICLGLMTNWYKDYFDDLCVVSLWVARRRCFGCDVEEVVFLEPERIQIKDQFANSDMASATETVAGKTVTTRPTNTGATLTVMRMYSKEASLEVPKTPDSTGQYQDTYSYQ